LNKRFKISKGSVVQPQDSRVVIWHPIDPIDVHDFLQVLESNDFKIEHWEDEFVEFSDLLHLLHQHILDLEIGEAKLTQPLLQGEFEELDDLGGTLGGRGQQGVPIVELDVFEDGWGWCAARGHHCHLVVHSGLGFEPNSVPSGVGVGHVHFQDVDHPGISEVGFEFVVDELQNREQLTAG
jgi:hypothetical protein